MKHHFILRALPLAAAVALGACSSVVAVKDVAADQDAYLRQKFTTADINPAVAAKLPKVAGRGFGQLVITREGVTEGSDGKKDSNVLTTTYIDGGNGLVSYKTELSNNGIPYALMYATSYRGLLTLRSQVVPLRLQNSGSIFEVKEIDDVTALGTETGSTFRARYKTGMSIQFANFSEREKSCTAVRRFAAAELNGKLTGNAVEFDCEERSNNAVQDRSKWALLEQYGLAVQIEGVSATSKSTYRITDVKA